MAASPAELAARGKSLASILLLLGWALYPWSALFPLPGLPREALLCDFFFAAAGAALLPGWLQSPPLAGAPLLRLALVIYPAWAVLSLVMHGQFELRGVARTCFLIELMVLTAAVATCASNRAWLTRLRTVTTVNALLVVAVGTAGLAFYLTGFDNPLIGTYGDLPPAAWYGRVQAGFTHPNMLASWAVTAAVLIDAGPGARGRLHVWSGRLLWLAPLLAFSRSALTFAYARLLRSHSPRISRGGRASAGLVVAAILVLLTVAPPNWEGGGLPDPSAPSPRRDAITSSWRQLRASPWFGSGPARRPGTARGIPFDAHLAPLNVAAGLGLPALAALALLFTGLWRARGPAPHPLCIAAWTGLAALALEGLSSDVEDFRHLWLLAGIGAGAASLPGGEPIRPPPSPGSISGD